MNTSRNSTRLFNVASNALLQSLYIRSIKRILWKCLKNSNTVFIIFCTKKFLRRKQNFKIKLYNLLKTKILTCFYRKDSWTDLIIFQLFWKASVLEVNNNLHVIHKLFCSFHNEIKTKQVLTQFLILLIELFMTE